MPGAFTVPRAVKGSLEAQEPDFRSVLELARALREQVDWDEVHRRTRSSPFAKAYFTLLKELGIIDVPQK